MAYCKRVSLSEAESYVKGLTSLAFRLRFNNVDISNSILTYTSNYQVWRLERGIRKVDSYDNWDDANRRYTDLYRYGKNRALFAFRNSDVDSDFDFIERRKGDDTFDYYEEYAENKDPKQKLYYIAYDEVGNVVGYSTSVNNITGQMKMTMKYAKGFTKDSKFVIQAYVDGQGQRGSFQTYRLVDGVPTYYFVAPSSTSISGGESRISKLYLGEFFGEYDKTYTAIDPNSFKDIQATKFAQEGKCPYTNIFKGSCKPIPYSVAEPALLKAQEYTQELNSGFTNNITQNVDLTLPLASNIVLYGIYFNYGDIIRYDPYYERGDDMFFYAVDKNGLIRLSSAKGFSEFSVTQRNTFGYAEVLPFLYGIQTTGLREGDPLYVYYSNENSDSLIFINSGINEDGSFPFKLGRVDYYSDFPQVVDGENIPCPKDIKLSVWGWLDEVGSDLAQVDSLTSENQRLNDEVFTYEQSEAEWDEEKALLEARPTQEQYDALQTQLDARPTQEQYDELSQELEARPTITPSDSEYGAFFETLNQGLTDSISRLSSALGSNEAEDEVDGEQSNFSGNDPFRYKKNKY